VLVKLKALPPAHKAAAAAVCVLLVVVVALLASTGDPTVRRTDANFFNYLLDLETCQIHFTLFWCNQVERQPDVKVCASGAAISWRETVGDCRYADGQHSNYQTLENMASKDACLASCAHDQRCHVRGPVVCRRAAPSQPSSEL
jgi:hypothetical protein